MEQPTGWGAREVQCNRKPGAGELRVRQGALTCLQQGRRGWLGNPGIQIHGAVGEGHVGTHAVYNPGYPWSLLMQPAGYGLAS